MSAQTGAKWDRLRRQVAREMGIAKKHATSGDYDAIVAREMDGRWHAYWTVLGLMKDADNK